MRRIAGLLLVLALLPVGLAAAIGGPLGLMETSLPAVAFVSAYGLSGSDTNVAAGVAVGLALLLALGRLARRAYLQSDASHARRESTRVFFRATACPRAGMRARRSAIVYLARRFSAAYC